MLVDDEPQILLSAQMLLRTAGIGNVITLDDSRKVLSLIGSAEIGVIVLDISMPHMTGQDLLAAINRDHPQIPVIFMTAMNDLETAVACMRGGAFDYLLKPVEKGRFVTSVTLALEMRSLKTELLSLKDRLLTDEIENASAFSSIITQNKKMRSIFQYIEVIAGTRQPVLITGETGVGKELIARATHTASGLKGEFVPVNVAGLDDTMFSDALFGHRKGAFTGAEEAREGMIARAAGGTLFLDEIGDMTESSQIKLLRLMQEHMYYPLGSDIPRQSNARILVATNRDIHDLIASGKFRKDLYYRLRAHHIHIPPLRERTGDVQPLLEHFLEKSAASLGRKRPNYPNSLITLLSNYTFPGNVRELEMMVFDAAARSKGNSISMESFREIIGGELPADSSNTFKKIELSPDLLGASPVLPTLKEAEDYLIREALSRSNDNQGIAASLLGITRQALNKRLSRKKKK